MKRSTLLLVVLCMALIPSRAQAQCQIQPVNSPPLDSTILPLPVLGTGLYKGRQGGLYPDGLNDPPQAHRTYINQATQKIYPSGSDSLLGFLALGISNAAQEFGAFLHDQNANPDRNARIIFVDGSEGGQDVEQSIDVDENFLNGYWNNVAEKVAAAGLTPDQIRVVWLKTTSKLHSSDFDQQTTKIRTELVTLMRIIKTHYVNVQIAYVSSRIFGGFVDPPTEPHDYEEAFAFKQLIEDQINFADPNINFLTGTVPLILWGPYIWSNADLQPYQSLMWCPEDYEDGGTNRHPNETGEQMVADALSDFFANDKMTRRWWFKEPDAAVSTFTPTADTFIEDDEDAGCTTLDQGSAPYLYTQHNALKHRRAFVTFDIGAETRPIIRAYLGLRSYPDKLAVDGDQLSVKGGEIRLVNEAYEDWQENSFTWCDQPRASSQIVFDIPKGHPRGSYVNVDVTEAMQYRKDGIVSFRIDSDSLGDTGVLKMYMSREEDPLYTKRFPPQLTLIVDDTGTACAGCAVPREEPAGASFTAYPNPFNPSARLEFRLQQPDRVRIAVFDVLGREVARLVDDRLEAGAHAFTFDGTRLSSGIYFAQMRTSSGILTQKIILQK